MQDAIDGFTESIGGGLGKSETYTAWVMRGWCFHHQGRMEESLTDFDAAVADDPSRVVGWYSRGIAHKRGGRAHQAKEDCDHAVDLTWEDLARASLEDFGLPPLGVEEQMCDVPEGIRVFFTQLAGAVIGDEMFGLRCFDAAVSAYSLALRSTANATLVVPRDALSRWHFQRGHCFFLLSRIAEAMSDFTTVISKVPENKPKLADAHFFRGHLFSQQDKWVEAQQDLLVCLKLKPNHETAAEVLKAVKQKLSNRARCAEEAERQLLAQLDKDQEREKKKREKNKQKKQRQKEKKRREDSDNPEADTATKTAEPANHGPEESPANPPDSWDSDVENGMASEQIEPAQEERAAVAPDRAKSEIEESDDLDKNKPDGQAGEVPTGSASSDDGNTADTHSTVISQRPGAGSIGPTAGLMEESDCPLCCEPFDATDLAFTPCPCGYKVCVWCYHRLKDDTDGQCPACRQRYREVEQKVVQVAKRVTTEKDAGDRRTGAVRAGKSNEEWMSELFATTNGGLRQSELDKTVVDMLRKLEPALFEPAIEKFRSVTTWATIRNKSGFVTAEMHKLRANWSQQQQQQQQAPAGAGRGGAAQNQQHQQLLTQQRHPDADSRELELASAPGKASNSWAAAVRPGEGRGHAEDEREETAAPAGKQPARERKRPAQQPNASGGGGEGELIEFARACVREHYRVRLPVPSFLLAADILKRVRIAGCTAVRFNKW